MSTTAPTGLIARFGLGGQPRPMHDAAPPGPMAWERLSRAARVYVSMVIAVGAVVLVQFRPRTAADPWLFAVLLLLACLTASWKVNLLIPLRSGSTLSVSIAAKLMTLLLLGPAYAVIVAVAAALTQCTYRVRERYPAYRTVFSMGADAITVGTTGVVYGWLGGSTGPFDFVALARPLVGAIAAYFFVNTSLIAGAIALSSGRRVIDVWRDDFLWSGVTFLVAGSAGAMAAVVVDRGDHWVAILFLAPVYLTYRTYQIFVGRLEDQQRHMADMTQSHRQTIDALTQAHHAEQTLAAERERLAVALAEMTRLEDARNQLLVREQAARASAEQANRLKDEFVAIVSHELRTPLNAILGWADLLHRKKLEGPQRDRGIQAVYESARRQAQLIDDLLDVARIMSGKMRLQRTLVDIEDVVQAALNVVQGAAESKRIDVRVESEAFMAPLYGDRARLQQVVWNLLANAIKFTPERGLITVRLRRVNDVVELSVADTGEGIPEHLLETIFEPFRQADGSATRAHGGLGLGLSIVKQLVEGHSGTIVAQSRGEGHGATFIVRLPNAMVSGDLIDTTLAEHHSKRPKPPARAPGSLDGLSVLVVDDDEESRRVAAAQLAGYQASVLTASSAAQALELLESEHVDVLVADIAMPGEDGYSLIRKLRALNREDVASIPAAALTAFARSEDRQKALRAGFQLHLTKPIDAHSLVAAVATLGGRVASPQ
jgi:signal transduction histidine kinase/ActR/RegA family two-component response regulator